MKYYEVNMTIEPCSQDAQDLLAALTAEAGMETFEEAETGLKGYAQQQLFDEDAFQQTLAAFPMEGVTISYNVSEAEDKDWNEQWELEGFEPIEVRSKTEDGRGERLLVIHDGRHLPSDISHQSSALMIEIDAHMAFGTGTHETTRMICETILELADAASTKPAVLDCGTGTGILSICALKAGATKAVGYDIDEWSVDNARHNAVINGVDAHFESLLGDATVLNQVDGQFDLVLANINRNILLADMPQFCTKMAAGAHLILSGFYTADNAQLIGKAETLGLRLQTKKEDHDWSCLVFSKC